MFFGEIKSCWQPVHCMRLSSITELPQLHPYLKLVRCRGITCWRMQAWGPSHWRLGWWYWWHRRDSRPRSISASYSEQQWSMLDQRVSMQTQTSQQLWDCLAQAMCPGSLTGGDHEGRPAITIQRLEVWWVWEGTPVACWGEGHTKQRCCITAF